MKTFNVYLSGIARSRSTLRGATLLLAALLLIGTGCDMTAPEAEQPQLPQPTEVRPPDPRVIVSSYRNDLWDGSPGVYFFASAEEDLFFRSVEITPPPPFRKEVINLYNTHVVQEQWIGIGTLPRVNGEWTFTFRVTRSSGSEELYVRSVHAVTGKKDG